MLHWRKCADVSPAQFKEAEREKDEMVEEKQFSLQSALPVVQSYYAKESAERLTLFQNDVGK